MRMSTPSFTPQVLWWGALGEGQPGLLLVAVTAHVTPSLEGVAFDPS